MCVCNPELLCFFFYCVACLSGYLHFIMIDISNICVDSHWWRSCCSFCQALEAISEVGDLLQLKYSRREQPLPSLGWMAEESLLQDWATSSSPPSPHPDPRLLTLPFLFLCPSFSSEPVSSPHHGLTTTRVLHLFRKTCTPASLISGVQSVTSTFHAYSSGRTKITPSTFLSVVTKQFRAFQFVLTYCDCIGLTLSLTPVCTSNVCLICAIIITRTTWSSFVVQTTVKQSRPIFFFFFFTSSSYSCARRKKKSDSSRCYDVQKSKKL